MTSPNFLRVAGWAAILGAAANLLGLITFIMFMAVGDFGPLADVPSLLWVAFTIPVALALHWLGRWLLKQSNPVSNLKTEAPHEIA